MTRPTSPSHDDRASLRAKMPADVDAPDKIFYGLTFRQLAVLAVAAVVGYAGWRGLHQVAPVPVLLAAGGAILVAAAALAVGRRDGLSLDSWLLHAVRHGRAPKAVSTIDTAQVPLPVWVDPPKQRVTLPAPLRLPADDIDDDGQITLTTGRAAIVAATTVNLGLRTGDEQAALVDLYGRWLNSLSTPTQIVVSAQPVDLASHARTLVSRAAGMPHPALERACTDHAAFLDDLIARRDPLRRQVLIVTRTAPSEPGAHAARRRADDTARALSGLGVAVNALDGAAATAAIAAAADPYQPPTPGRRATPTTTITGPPGRSGKSRGRTARRTR
jgi:hypothetical protein